MYHLSDRKFSSEFHRGENGHSNVSTYSIYSIYTVSTVTTVSTQYLQYLQYLRTSLLAAALPLLAGVGLDLGAVVRVAEQLARAVEEPGEALGDEL